MVRFGDQLVADACVKVLILFPTLSLCILGVGVGFIVESNCVNSFTLEWDSRFCSVTVLRHFLLITFGLESFYISFTTSSQFKLQCITFTVFSPRRILLRSLTFKDDDGANF